MESSRSGSSRTDVVTVALVGHRGAGKTSLAEAMLYLAGVTARIGRVDDGSSRFDAAPEEKAHLATLELSVAALAWAGRRIQLVDTPGEASLAAEVELALEVADAAILVVGARQGVQPGTERAARWVREHGLPCIVALARVDDAGAHPDELASELRQRLALPMVRMEVAARRGGELTGVIDLDTHKAWLGDPETPRAIPPELSAEVEHARTQLIDEVASCDDALAEKYLSQGDLGQADLDAGARRAIAGGRLVPWYLTSAIRPSGVAALLDGIVDLVPPAAERPPWRGRSGLSESEPGVERAAVPGAPLSLFVFKTEVDPHAGRLSWARVLSGVVASDQPLLQGGGAHERASHLMQLSGLEPRAAAEVGAGEIAILPRLKHTHTGDTLSDEKHPFVLPPAALPARLLSRVVLVEGQSADEKAAAALARLSEVDPNLAVSRDPATRDLVVSGPGTVHLEITLERLRRLSGLPCRLGPPTIDYRETVTRRVTGIEGKLKKQSGGHGQYAVCVIDLEPLPRGAGVEVIDEIVGGAIPRQFIASVEKGIQRARERGVLAGYPMVDFRVRLIDGKAHAVDSSDAAFQVAASKAFKAAARAAHPVLLEPIAKLTIRVPAAAMGEVMGDLAARRARILGTDADDDSLIIHAHAPLAELLEYEPVLRSLTQGLGSFTLAVCHLDICPPAVEARAIRPQSADDD